MPQIIITLKMVSHNTFMSQHFDPTLQNINIWGCRFCALFIVSYPLLRVTTIDPSHPLLEHQSTLRTRLPAYHEESMHLSSRAASSSQRAGAGFHSQLLHVLTSSILGISIVISIVTCYTSTLLFKRWAT